MNRLETRLKVIPEGFLRDFGGIGIDFQCAAEAVLHIALSALWRANRFASGCRAAGLCPQERNRDIMRKKLLSRMRVRSESGFTLIEVIVAVVILTVVGMTAANFAVRSLVTSREMQQRAAAASLAQDQLEKLQSQISSNAETSGHAQSYFNAFVKNISKGGYKQVNSDLNGSVLPDFQNAVGGISVYNNGTIESGGVPAVKTIRKSDTDYTLYAVVAKCFRSSDSMTLLTSMPSGTYTYLDLDKKTSVDDLNSPADYVEGRFSDSSGKTYYPMLRLTVFAKWDNNSKSNDCIYSVTKLIDLSDDGKLN